jgi:hypothetical protein
MSMNGTNLETMRAFYPRLPYQCTRRWLIGCPATGQNFPSACSTATWRYHETWRERHITPGARSTQFRYAEVLDSDVGLDVGCGRTISPDWILGQKQTAGRVREDGTEYVSGQPVTRICHNALSAASLNRRRRHG